MGVATSVFGNSDAEETTTNDYSRAFGGSADYSTGHYGASVSGGDLTGATVNVLDPGAIAAGRDIALSGLTGAFQAAQRQTDSAASAVDKALQLAGVTQEGSAGTLIRGLIALALVAVLGFGFWAWSRRPKKKKG